MKRFVIDTSVLVYDPNALKNFKDNTVIISIAVLEELDKLKSGSDEKARNCRQVIRKLDEISNSGEIFKGVKIENNVTVVIDVAKNEKFGASTYGDNVLLGCLDNHTTQYPEKQVALVSKDINLRLRAKAFGMLAEDYETDKVENLDSVYSGFRTIKDKRLYEDLMEHKVVDSIDYKLRLYPNQCLQVDHLKKSILARESNGKIRLCDPPAMWGLNYRNREQVLLADLLLDTKIPLVTTMGSAGSGKAQPLDAKILTPSGWTTMGKLNKGDVISTPDGKSAKVLEIFPQGKKDIYKMTFSDGSSTECCDDHLWVTKNSLERENKKSNGSIKSTNDIRNSILYSKGKKCNHTIPITNAVEMNKNNLLLDPYAFGCLLGDGTFRHHLGFSNKDQFVIDSVEKSLNKIDLKMVNSNGYDYNITGLSSRIKNYKTIICYNDNNYYKLYNSINEVKNDNFSINSVYKAIEKNKIYNNYKWKYGKYIKSSEFLNYLIYNNLWMKKSEEKHIPDDYKYSSIEDRLALLQGLMDTDGGISKNSSTCEFYTSSEKLCKDVVWLVQSLGGIAKVRTKIPKYIYKLEKKVGLKCYTVVLTFNNDIIPFRLPRKVELLKPRTKYFPTRFIRSIELVGKKEAQCILINSKEHLYITDDCIVTHNTLISLASALELVLEQKKYEKVILYRSIEPLGREIGHLPGTLEEKMGPFMDGMFDNLDFLMNAKNKGDSKKKLAMYMEKGVIEIGATTFIRGRSLQNTFVILDESQNISPHEMKTILTRAGEGSKFVIIGDAEQIDSPYLDSTSNGLSILIEKFKASKLAGHITLTKGERSALATEAAEIL